MERCIIVDYSTETERLKPVPASAYKHLKLEGVNAVTWKVVDPNIKTDVPSKHGHWAGYRTTKALAWVIDLGYGKWMAHRDNEVCNPTNLAEAKRQALAMAVGGIGDYQVSVPSRNTNSYPRSSRGGTAPSSCHDPHSRLASAQDLRRV